MENKLFFIGKIDKNIEKIAKDKGYSKIFFIKEINSIDNKEYAENEKYNSCLIDIEHLETLRRAIDKAESKFNFIFVLGLDDQINRVALENRKVKGLVSPEFNRKFDYIHYRNSGLNHVLVKIAKENKKMMIQDISFMQGASDKKIKAQILGKILQNYMLARKFKLNELFILTFIAESEKEIQKFADVKEFYEGFLTEIK